MIKPPANPKKIRSNCEKPRIPPTTQSYRPNLPPQPSQYSWADGFTGVVVPTREIDPPVIPNSNSVSSQPSDYWEDVRRQ